MHRYGRIGLALGLVLLLAAGLLRTFWFDIQFQRHRSLIEPAARQYNLPPRLIAAVIWQETRFDATRTGEAGEIGLMQVTRNAALDWVRAEHIRPFAAVMLSNPVTNVLAGSWYLRHAIARWADRPDPLPYALAEYNAGPLNARRWAAAARDRSPAAFLAAITYPATRRYVRAILRHAGAPAAAGFKASRSAGSAAPPGPPCSPSPPP